MTKIGEEKSHLFGSRIDGIELEQERHYSTISKLRCSLPRAEALI